MISMVFSCLTLWRKPSGWHAEFSRNTSKLLRYMAQTSVFRSINNHYLWCSHNISVSHKTAEKHTDVQTSHARRYIGHAAITNSSQELESLFNVEFENFNHWIYLNFNLKSLEIAVCLAYMPGDSSLPAVMVTDPEHCQPNSAAVISLLCNAHCVMPVWILVVPRPLDDNNNHCMCVTKATKGPVFFKSFQVNSRIENGWIDFQAPESC